MNDGPVVDELHRMREEMLAEYGGDLHALVVTAERPRGPQRSHSAF